MVLGANPAYALPPGSGWSEAVGRVKQVVALSPYLDETAAGAGWVLPVNTPLESWGDYEPQTGVANLLQPVMGTALDTRMAGDALLALAEAAGVEMGAADFYGFLRERWREKLGSPADFEQAWQEAVQCGGVWSQPAAVRPTGTPPRLRFSPPEKPMGTSLWVYPTVDGYDGRGANRRWLQELPDPITKIGWASWVELNYQDAAAQGIAAGDLVQVQGPEGEIVAAARPDPGVAAGVVAVPLGHGHTEYGRYARGVGVNAYLLAGAGAVTVTRTGRRELPPCVDGSPYQWGREIVRTVGLAEAETAAREAAGDAAARRVHEGGRPLPAARIPGAPLGDGD